MEREKREMGGKQDQPWKGRRDETRTSAPGNDSGTKEEGSESTAGILTCNNLQAATTTTRTMSQAGTSAAMGDNGDGGRRQRRESGLVARRGGWGGSLVWVSGSAKGSVEKYHGPSRAGGAGLLRKPLPVSVKVAALGRSLASRLAATRPVRDGRCT
jgi:hypothetical protein